MWRKLIEKALSKGWAIPRHEVPIELNEANEMNEIVVYKKTNRFVIKNGVALRCYEEVKINE